MDTRKILFEKFEDILAMEHKMAQAYEECLRLTEDKRVMSLVSKILEDEIKHAEMARKLLEIAQG